MEMFEDRHLLSGVAESPAVSPVDYTQPGPFQVGSTQVTVTRTAGGSGTFSAEIFYPATASGSNTPVDGSDGPYPVVSFGHGYYTDALAEYTLSMTQIASYGYIVIAPLSYESILDVLNTAALGHDLTSSFNYLVSQDSTAASPFYQNVVTSGYAAMGHSMGGAASISEATYSTSVKTVVTWAAQNMSTPNAYTQMPNVQVPMEMIAGTQDGIVAASTTSTIYADGNTPITLNDLVGGYHFGFEDYGAGIGADSGSMPRATELGYARSFTVEWLNLYMKGDQSAWRQLWGPEAAQDPQVQYSVKSGIAVTANTAQLSGNGGAVLDYSITVQNNGTYATSYSLFAEDNSWATSFSTLQTPVLNVGGSTTLHVFVTVPLGLLAGATDNVLISARNDTDGGTRGYVQLQSVALGGGPPVVDLNGAAGGADYTSNWIGAGPVAISDPANAFVSDPDGGNLASLTVTLTSPRTGDVLAANTTGTTIAQSYSNGTLSLTGSDTLADYQAVLRTITYDNTGGGPSVASETAIVVANDGSLNSTQVTATININTAPTVDLNGAGAGTGFTSNWNGVSPVVITDPANATVVDDGNLASMTVTLASPATGDVLAANTTGTSITAVYSASVLTLTGVDTPADYQQVLRTITYNNTAGGPGVSTESATVVATDNGPGTPLSSLSVTATININTAPTVDLNGAAAGTSFMASWSGSAAVAITAAANATVTDDGSSLASMTVTLTSLHTGDVLAANTTGTSITQSYSAGVLTLSGVDTLADYQQVLRTVTYNNTNNGPGVAVETATVVANDGSLNSAAVTSTINMPAPSLSLTAGAGSGAPNYTTTWYNQGTIPMENNVLATVTALSGVSTLSSVKVTLATFHTGDVLALAPLGGVSLALTSSYSAGTLTLSGTDTVAHYQQALRFINYNNTVGGPGATPIVATFVANDGTHASNPVTSTINVNVGSGQVLGNRLFYNNSKYDGNNGGIAATDDAAIASDKTGYNGTGTATFANVSAFNKGITGIMVDLQSGLGTHTAITAGDISFKVSPTTFVTTTFNQLSTWSAGPTPAAVSVRIGAGQGGSDRLEITFGTSVVKNEWLEVNVHSGGNTGLSANDVFYFGSVIGDSGAADTALLAKTDGNDYNVPFNNIVGLTTPVWNLADYTKDGKVDGSDATTAISNVFTLHYIANPTGPFAPNGGGSAAPAASPAATPASVVSPTASSSVAGAISSGLSILSSLSSNTSSIRNSLEHVLTSPPVTKAIQTALHNPQLLQAVEQFVSQFKVHDDALDGLLADLGIE
jgi:dienelactone hydrolase